MTSKTFHDDDRKLEVQENGGQINLYIEGEINELGINLAPSDAPALAFAILEAAGVPMQGKFERHRSGTSEHLSFIAQHLERYVVESEHLTAEAEAQAKLEAEALELRNEYFGKECAWSDINDVGQAIWLRMARKAREMAKENQ